MMIDKKIANLVEALNKLPGIYTYSSCVGHDNPTQGQRQKDNWYVAFDCEKTENGWKSIDIITQAIDITDFHGTKFKPSKLIIWYNGGTSLQIEGENNPNDVAAAITELAKNTTWSFDRRTYQREYMRTKRKQNPKYGQKAT
jgi:hypothetical protein